MQRMYQFPKSLNRAVAGMAMCVAVSFLVSTLPIRGQKVESHEAVKRAAQYCSVVEKWRPRSAKEIADLLMTGRNVEALQEGIKIARGSQERVRNKSISGKDRLEAAKECEAAWRLTLHIAEHSPGAKVKQEAVKSWDRELTNDRSSICQLAALDIEFSRRYLTKRLWSLFEHTKDPMLMQAICAILAEHGTLADKTALERRSKTARSAQLRSSIWKALSYIEYHAQKRKNYSIPRQLPPNMPKLEAAVEQNRPVGR